MTILVFPSNLEASAAFATEARRWGRRVVGASALDPDPNRDLFDAWGPLPFIGEPDFIDRLAALIEQHGVTGLYTPHAPSFHLLEQLAPARFPKLELIGPGPFKRVMGRIEAALEDADQALTQIAGYGLGAFPFPPAFLAGLLSQAQTIHGECARDKILALCAVLPTAPRGDVVEIGALFGKSSYVLNRLAVQAGIGATLCIDPWSLGPSVQTSAPAHIQSASGGWDWDLVHAGFLQAMTACAAPPVNYLRMLSDEARGRYGPGARVISPEFGETVLSGAISLLHIDGNHDEAAVAQDYALWGPLVTPGGWVVFDDYNWPHGDGPRKVADRAIAELGARAAQHFVAGGAMFVNLAG